MANLLLKQRVLWRLPPLRPKRSAYGGASTLLFGLKPWDPVTLVTVVASVVPSLRAANVNPIDSLRAE
jgi:hypothetical protein